jgi:hypothetical protein
VKDAAHWIINHPGRPIKAIAPIGAQTVAEAVGVSPPIDPAVDTVDPVARADDPAET